VIELQSKREELRRLLEELANIQSQIASTNQKNQVFKIFYNIIFHITINDIN
jgi:hypothetical protein